MGWTGRSGVYGSGGAGKCVDGLGRVGSVEDCVGRNVTHGSAEARNVLDRTGRKGSPGTALDRIGEVGQERRELKCRVEDGSVRVRRGRLGEYWHAVARQGPNRIVGAGGERHARARKGKDRLGLQRTGLAGLVSTGALWIGLTCNDRAGWAGYGSH